MGVYAAAVAGSRQPPFELPEWLRRLLASETAETDADRLEGRLRRTGIAELGHKGDATRPTHLTWRSPRHTGRLRIDESGEAAVTAAVHTLVDRLEIADQWMRLGLAATDMESVAAAAAALAPHRPAPGSAEEPLHNPFAPVDDILDVGLVVTYARSFTGKAELGSKWRPPAGPDRDLHQALIAARSRVYAHADHTAHRSIIDTSRLLGEEGEPVFGVAHTRISGETLRRLAAMCEAQAARFAVAAAELEPIVRAGAAQPEA